VGLICAGVLCGIQRPKVQALTGDYLGQDPPGAVPEIFARGIVSTQRHEFNAAFSPDGREFFFSVSESSGRETMMRMVRMEGQWSRPQAATFVCAGNDCDPFFTPDGRRLYFISTRPKSEGGKSKDWDIWYVDHTSEGWSQPVNIGPPINSAYDEYYVSLTTQGTVYFASNRPGGLGSFDIYRSRFVEGQYVEPENLGAEVNSPHLEHDPYISPDERYMIFTSVNRPGGFGEGDLYISTRHKDGSWTRSENLGKAFNTSGYDFCPMVSPDGKYFFFTRQGDIYWVSMQAIREF
jgi:Tol biopolymer transport system component